MDTTTALGYQQDLYAALAFVLPHGFNFQSSLGPGPVTYNQAGTGSISGTLTITGGVGSDGNGWQQLTYSNYADATLLGIVQDGAVIQYQNASGTNTFGFSHYRVTVEGITTEYDGTLTGSTQHYTADLSIGNGSQQLLLSNFVVATTGTTAYDLSVSGQMYDSALGYVTLSTPMPLDDSLTSKGPIQDFFALQGASGDIALVGSGGATLHIQPLGYTLNYMGLDLDGDGKIDMGARLDLSTGALDAVQQTGTTVLAIAKQATAAQTTGSITLDGRFSYTPGAYVSYSWQLLVAPLGSKAQVSGSEPTTQLTPDVPGDYLVQLTATANGKSAIDVIAITDPGFNAGAVSNIPTTYGLPGYISAHAGAPVVLDARGAVLGGDTWFLFKPDGSMTTIPNTSPYFTSFTPSVAGIYYVVLGGSASGVHWPLYPATTTVIAVDEPVRFAPPAFIYNNAQSLLAGFNAANFGGSAPGLAFTSLSIAGGSNTIQWWGTATDGLFGAGGTITLGAGETQALLATDLNADGVADFVTPTYSTVSGCPLDIRQSVSGGYSPSSVTLFPGCDNQDGVLFMRDGTLGGHKAVVAATFYYGSSHVPAFVAFVEDSSRVLQAPVITAMNGGSSSNGHIHDFQLQDVDGDGEPDLIAHVSYEVGVTPVEAVQVYHGNGDGSFTFMTSYTPADFSGVKGPLVIGDFNGDGKLDIAVATNKTLNLFYGDGAGHFSATPDTRALNCTTSYMDALDLNHDGHLDLVVTEDGCSNVPPAVSLLDLFLSDSSGGLGTELHYPLISANSDLSPPIFFNEGAQGDFNGDGLSDLMLAVDAFPSLVYLPQLPAVTSATITAAARNTEQIQQPKPAATARHEWLKTVARTRVVLPSH